MVFTKHDQFLINVAMHMSDYPDKYSDNNVSEVAEKQFQEHYLKPLGNGSIKFVLLKRRPTVKFQEHMLMYFGRNAHARQSL